MSTTAGTPAAAAPAGAPRRPAVRVTAARVLRAEWGSYWSLPSTHWLVAGVAVLTAVLGPIAAAAGEWDEQSAAGGADAISVSLFGADLALLLLAVLGVLSSAGEYTTGAARSTFTAVPTRLPVLWAKAAVHGAAVFGVGLAACATAFTGAAPALDGTALEASWGDPGIARAVLGAAGQLALFGLLALGLGSLTRSVAGGLAATVVGVMVVPQMINLLPGDLAEDASSYTPSSAAEAMMALDPAPGGLGPTAGTLVLTAYAAAVLGAAAWRLVRRDV